MRSTPFTAAVLTAAALAASPPAWAQSPAGPSSPVRTTGQPWLELVRPGKGPQFQVGAPAGPSFFRRVATFPVFLNTDVDEETVAEIVAATSDGNTLVYTDSQTDKVGFVDITDPRDPQPGGTLDLPGEPTSVAVVTKPTLQGPVDYALVCVNTSADFVNTSGELLVIEVDTRQVVRTIPLGGQPDAIAVSPSGFFACVAIENERDEDLGDGAPPQAPAGFLVVVDMFGRPANWGTRTIGLDGIADKFPDDPEPEFVDVNEFGVAAVTLQENNHVVLVHLASGAIIADWPAGEVDLTQVDTDDDGLIEQEDDLDDLPREPDAVAWISPIALATADEGDLDGGSRGFTTWFADGTPAFGSGNSLEHLAARLGHYPEGRSDNKGVEPEGVEFGWYGLRRFLFVGSERANLVFVFELVPGPVIGAPLPVLRQALPTGIGPEGLLAIPSRDLFVVACEEDARDDKFRASLMIYERSQLPAYPTIVSENRAGSDLPIPWGALSGLASDGSRDTVYTVHDSFYRHSRVYRVDRSQPVARITDEIPLNDSWGRLWVTLIVQKGALGPGLPDFDLDAIIEPNGRVNLDLEGIAVDERGHFWLVSEGAGNATDGVSDPARPFQSPNLILEVEPSGRILQAWAPPYEVSRNQSRFGLEGVAKVGQYVYVVFQRAWREAGDPPTLARIGRLDTTTNQWSFAYYPLEAPTSPNGGWVGLSDLTYLGDDWFAVVERDDQGGTDAAIKHLTRFSIAGLDWRPYNVAPNFEVVVKELVSDLIADDVFGPFAGFVPEKVEGLAALPGGSALIVNDNDGVDDNNGETLLIEVENLFP